MTDQQQIDEILIEANAYYMRPEVTKYAMSLIKEGYSAVKAYQQAYQQIII